MKVHFAFRLCALVILISLLSGFCLRARAASSGTESSCLCSNPRVIRPVWGDHATDPDTPPCPEAPPRDLTAPDADKPLSPEGPEGHDDGEGLDGGKSPQGQTPESPAPETNASPPPSPSPSPFIRWVDFDVSYEALLCAYNWDVKTHEDDHPVDWVTLLAIVAAQNGDMAGYTREKIDKVAKRLHAGETAAAIASKYKTYPRFKETLDAILGEYVGYYETQDESGAWVSHYGLKAFSPIAKGYGFSHFDDFGVARGYGYKRRHLGHDMMAGTGTPVCAVEGGIVEALGWNQYGGWRVGIRSFDGKRYYYYAHLRQNRPFHCDMKIGHTVTAGDVIGYVGRTGYSRTENKNNINVPHLHWGLQLIFDECQRQGPKEIWVDIYPLTKLLQKNQVAVRKDENKEAWRVTPFRVLSPVGPNLPSEAEKPQGPQHPFVSPGASPEAVTPSPAPSSAPPRSA